MNHLRTARQLRYGNTVAFHYNGTLDDARRLRTNIRCYVPNRIGRTWLTENNKHIHFMVTDDTLLVSLQNSPQHGIFTDQRSFEVRVNQPLAASRATAARRPTGMRRVARGERRFGVELEVVGISRQTAMTVLAEAGLDVADYGSYTHRVSSSWKVVTDASICNGCEIVSPPLAGEDGLRQLKTATRALRAAGASVDRSCGTHVHVDGKGLTGEELASVIEFYATRQASFSSLVSQSRRGGQWCQSYQDTELQGVLRAFRAMHPTSRRVNTYADRYRTVNVQSFPKYGTLEFRQHQGSLSFEKLAAWVVLLVAIFDASADNTLPAATDLAGFVRGLGVEDVQWYTERAMELAA